MTKQQDGFSDAEKAAMKERAGELKAEARASKKRSEGEEALLKAIAEMPEHDRVLADRFHAIVSSVAPELWPKTWYGMPACSAPIVMATPWSSEPQMKTMSLPSSR